MALEQAAELRVSAARRDLAAWRRGQLAQLRERGHASWRELAEAELELDRSRARYAAADGLMARLTQLRGRFSQPDRRPSNLDGDAAPPSSTIRLSLPGSARIVCWVDARHLPPEGATAQLRLLRALHQADAQQEDLVAAAAAEACAVARSRVERLGKAALADATRPPRDLARARLECAVALAEWDLARARQARRQREAGQLEAAASRFTATRQEPTSGAPGQFVQVVDHRVDPVLLRATLREAEAEAASDGLLAAAQVDGERAGLRQKALARLHQEGHASRQELDDARRQVAAARQWIDLLRTHQQLLTQARDHLGTPPTGPVLAAAAQPHAGHAGSPGPELPASLLADESALRHLMALRRMNADQQAAAAELRSEARFRQSLLDRLATAGAASEAAAGERRMAELDLQYCRALEMAAEQRRRVLDLEAERFVRQVEVLGALNGGPGGRPALPLATGLDEAPGPEPPGPRARYSYLEASDFRLLLAWMRTSPLTVDDAANLAVRRVLQLEQQQLEGLAALPLGDMRPASAIQFP